MNRQMEACGLGAQLGVQAVVDIDDPRAHLMGKTVRYLDNHFTGTLARDYDYQVREIQNDYKGSPIVRIYCLAYEDNFGSAADPKDLRIVEDHETVRNVLTKEDAIPFHLRDWE